MTFHKLISGFLTLSLFSIILITTGCSDDNDNNPKPPKISDCEVLLFDGDNFSDNYIVLEGSGQYPDLSNLPNSKTDWTDEADSFKAGERAVVTFYSKPNFQGDSTVFDMGAQKGSLNHSPQSIKIQCRHKMQPMTNE
ncbi:MAG TPA: hypothetical protein VK084_07260 [Chitinophagaceae bacterium]|nr:hypothetical protein [Chitinophagaceae bacterium]